jgi:hypothetical protein
VLRVLLLCLALIGCTSRSTEDAGQGGGGGITATGGGSSAGGGSGGGTATGGGAGGGGTGTGGGGTDAGSGTGVAGSACNVPGDCASGNCVAWFRDAGSVCGQPCFDQGGCTSLPGFVCIPAPDGTGVCIPKSPAHCLPCDFDVNCGGLSEACVLAPGDTAMTCRIDCSLAGVAPAPPTTCALRRASTT